MAKFLIAASYTPEGLRGLAKDKASGRRKAVHDALAALGGKLDATTEKRRDEWRMKRGARSPGRPRRGKTYTYVV